MKLIERELGLEIEFKENRISVLIIENVCRRLDIIKTLYEQMLGNTGPWLLTESENTYDLSKKGDIVLEPFSLELNSKKMKVKLYQEIKEISDEECYELGLELHSNICNYLERILGKIPYPMEYMESWDVDNILKMYNVRLLEECDNLVEKLLNYIKLMNQICGIQLFFLVNIKQFLNEQQILELYKTASYNKIQLVLIEFNITGGRNTEEDVYILDKDDCIIEY